MAAYDACKGYECDIYAMECVPALRALLAETAGLRDAIEIEREGQRSMARALAEINRLSRLDVAVNLAEPAPACGSVSTVRSDDPPAAPLPTCANCGSNLIAPAPPAASDEVREAAEAFRVAAEAWGNCTCNAPDECDHLLRKRETAADLAYLTVAWLDAALSRPAAKGGE